MSIGQDGLVPSYYNFDLVLDDGRLVLYNTKTGAVAVVEADQREGVQQLLHGQQLDGDRPLESTLFAQGFLVPRGRDELADIRNWFNLYSNEKKLLHLTMLPAEACNFACPYCFQYAKRSILMKPWVYDAVFKFLEKLAEDNGEGTTVKLCWFGGEPTLAARHIVQFMKRLRPLPLTLHANIVTNGYLLSVDRFRELLDSGITEFQITLDGNKDTHDRLRVLKSGKPTFDVIYSNLKAISALDRSLRFTMAVRANFLRTDLASMEQLLSLFQQDFLEDTRFMLYFRPVYDFETTRCDIRDVKTHICTLSEGLAAQRELTLLAMRKLKREPYGRMVDPLPRPTPSWCPAERTHSYIVGADGLIFLCDTLVGDPTKAVGRITSDGEMDLPGAVTWKAPIFEDPTYTRCVECKLLPICMGGCRRVRLSGDPPCYWTTKDILVGMRQYVALYVDTALASQQVKSGPSAS